MDFLDPATGILLWANAAVIGTIIFGRRASSFSRSITCVATGVSVVCYLIWRLHYLLYSSGLNTTDAVLTKILFGFEVINFADFLVFLLTMSRYRDRSVEADRALEALRALPQEQWPPVDIFVATYNEEWGILEKTILAINLLDYPHKREFLLDDGKRDWLRDKCEQAGIGYIRREGNAHKKPGNHNYALTQTSAPFIAMFDADFIPMPNFLLRTVGLLLQNPKWGILQTPQTFYNYDPMRSNLQLQRSLPDDTAMFFTVIEPCRDAWGCAFYVGSCALVRREALEAIGGIVMGYDTEDQITSIAMLQSGYQTGFLNEPLSTGLAPESLSALFGQRQRWARGSVQISPSCNASCFRSSSGLSGLRLQSLTR
jgi:cellulose synthase (UDP-forming)